MGKALTYHKQASNTVKRHNERATYDAGTIHAIINSSNVVHVAFNPDPSDPFPTILPMIGQMGSFEYPSAGLDEPLDCYLHGYVSSRVMNLARSTGGDGLPTCVSATKVDGLAMALTPFAHSFNYRSAVLHGYAKLVLDEEEKIWAMKLITNSVVPDRWDQTRVPPSASEVASTAVLRVKIADGSAKVRDLGVSDDRKDKENEEVIERVWNGVIPVWETYGEPIPSHVNKVKDVPEHITSYLASKNEGNRNYATGVARANPSLS